MATKLVIPEPKRFLLEYRGANGKKHYTVSSPIEMNSKHITVYTFGGGGIKTFKIENILSMNLIGDSVISTN